jgi:hypothetical protein
MAGSAPAGSIGSASAGRGVKALLLAHFVGRQDTGAHAASRATMMGNPTFLRVAGFRPTSLSPMRAAQLRPGTFPSSFTFRHHEQTLDRQTDRLARTGGGAFRRMAAEWWARKVLAGLRSAPTASCDRVHRLDASEAHGHVGAASRASCQRVHLRRAVASWAGVQMVLCGIVAVLLQSIYTSENACLTRWPIAKYLQLRAK